MNMQIYVGSSSLIITACMFRELFKIVDRQVIPHGHKEEKTSNLNQKCGFNFFKSRINWMLNISDNYW